ncbi:IS110 family transposase [Salana multivorans]
MVGWVAGIAAERGPVAVAYEAGPTGFGLARALEGTGYRCIVAAPSKILRPSGDRVKTDARDAVLLARLLKLEELGGVRVPSVAEESARDLVRAREDARVELMAARHRLSKLLLRRGIVYPAGKDAWTGIHDAWLRRVRREGLAGAGVGTLTAFDAGYDTVTATLARRDRLDKAIMVMAGDSEFTAVTRRLACLRGVSTLTGFALAVEIGDWDRFTGRTIASYLGLVPSEYSSGASRRQGGITKTGNSHARRLLVEAAWHHKPRYAPGKVMHERWALAPAAAAARGDAGNRRLHKRWLVLASKNKKHTVANTAIARELAGWCWSLATM